MNLAALNESSGVESKNIKIYAGTEFMMQEKECWKFCKKVTTDQRFEQRLSFEGPGAASEHTEEHDIATVDYKEGYKTTIPQKQYAVEIRISWAARQFAVKSAQVSQQIGTYLGRAGTLAYEYKGANIIDYGYTDSAAYHGGDSKPLFSATHPWKTGGTYSNVLSTAAASKTSIKAAGKTVHNAKMENSIPANLKMNKILFRYENVYEIPEILTSQLDPETGNNRNNALKDEGLEMVILHYPTDTNGWEILTTDSDLEIVEAAAPFLATNAYPNKSIGENIFMSMNNGFAKPLGTYGNQGA
jgi:hypothetical protein